MILKKISIILPVYNGAKYLSEAIDSIISQTYTNWELIIVNDCSTDESLEIAESYQERDARIKVVSNECNLKLPRTLNRGFEEASGDYYTWTSDDNIYRPFALERLAKCMESDNTCSMVYSDYSIIDAEGRCIGEAKLQEPKFLVQGNVCGACFLYTSMIAKEVGQYDYTLFLAEDYDYWMRIYISGKMRHIPENLYCYRHHSMSLTESKKELIDMQTYKALEKNFLSLYAEATKNGLKYSFLDQIVSRSSEKCLDETRRKLICIEPRYKWYLRIQTIRNKIPKRIRLKIYNIVKGLNG